MNDIFIFLTRGEIHFHNECSLTIHLKYDDKRSKQIIANLDSIKLITVNPEHSKMFNIIEKNIWYLIPKLIYTGYANYDNYMHYSFEYRFTRPKTRNSLWKSVRILNQQEIDKFRKYQIL